MIKKYYNVIIDCFFDDHIISIGILNSIMHVEERFFNEIISITDHRKANQRMLNALIVILKSDDQMKNFCDAVLALCTRDKLCKEIVEFTRGDLRHSYVATYVHAYIYLYTHNCNAEVLINTYITEK